MSATGRLLCSIFIFFLTKDPQDVDGAVKCPTNSMGSQAAAATEEDTIFDFGRPGIHHKISCRFYKFKSYKFKAPKCLKYSLILRIFL